MTNSNNKVVPEAREALNRFKYEVANEVGVTSYLNLFKASLASGTTFLLLFEFDIFIHLLIKWLFNRNKSTKEKRNLFSKIRMCKKFKK